MADDDTRVVITGLGAVTCLGTGIDALWSGLVAGRSAFGPVTLFDTADLGCHLAGELPADLDLEGPFASWSARPRRRGDRIALLAAAEAMASAGLDPLPRELAPELGVAVLCGSGDALEYEDTLDAPDDPDAAGGPDPLAPAADWVAWRFGLGGPRLAVVTACSSGLVAVARAYEALRRGRARIMLAGGADVLSRLCFHGFQALRAMDPEPCKPFDRRRRGMTLGEGAGVLVLETAAHARARGAPVLAELLGYGWTSDAYHMATPDVSGESWARTVRDALAWSGVEPERLGYVNAHGTATGLNDRAETAALKLALGSRAPHVPVSSIKGAIGHCQFAAGAVELIATVAALRHGRLPPTLRLEEADPDCDLDYVPLTARAAEVDVALCSSFGFGGSSVVMVLGHGQEQGQGEG